MFNKELLDEVVRNSGLKLSAIQERTGIKRSAWDSRARGDVEFKPSEIVAVCSVLNLTKRQRELIFGI